MNGESAMGLAFEKAKKEYRAGRISAAVWVLKAAIGYKWFEAVYALTHYASYVIAQSSMNLGATSATKVPTVTWWCI